MPPQTCGAAMAKSTLCGLKSLVAEDKMAFHINGRGWSSGPLFYSRTLVVNWPAYAYSVRWCRGHLYVQGGCLPRCAFYPTLLCVIESQHLSSFHMEPTPNSWFEYITMKSYAELCRVMRMCWVPSRMERVEYLGAHVFSRDLNVTVIT